MGEEGVMKTVARGIGILFFGVLYWFLFDVAQYMQKDDLATTLVGLVMFISACASHSAWDWWKE
jgi:Kef-type K+ transport system membrane component KefB